MKKMRPVTWEREVEESKIAFKFRRRGRLTRAL
jgi:hypothetical protein